MKYVQKCQALGIRVLCKIRQIKKKIVYSNLKKPEKMSHFNVILFIIDTTVKRTEIMSSPEL